MGEKRKNGAPRRFQWGLLVVGFALGALLMVFVMQRQPPAAAPPVDTTLDAALWKTATQIIRDATASAGAPLVAPTQDAQIDSFMATATTIVAQATQTAQAAG